MSRVLLLPLSFLVKLYRLLCHPMQKRSASADLLVRSWPVAFVPLSTTVLCHLPLCAEMLVFSATFSIKPLYLFCLNLPIFPEMFCLSAILLWTVVSPLPVCTNKNVLFVCYSLRKCWGCLCHPMFNFSITPPLCAEIFCLLCCCGQKFSVSASLAL